MKQLRIFFLCLMAATLATACGDDNNDDNSVPVESITLNHETLTLKSGATETLVPTIVPDRVTAESVVWSSDKTSVATVSKDGLVTAVAEGTATITATAREKSATCLVTVSNKTLVTTVAELKTAIETADGTADAPTQIILGGYIEVAADAEHFAFSIDGKHIAIDGGNSPIGGNYNISRTASDKSLFKLINGASLKLTNLNIYGNADAHSADVACIFVRASCKLTLGNGFELSSGNGNDNDQLIGISVGDNATLIMEGDAEISKSIKGQEVLVAPTGILQLKGGKIKAREEGTYGSERSLCLQAAINGNQVTIPTVTVENELPADSDFRLDLYDYVLSRSTVRPGAETVVKGTDSYTLTDSDLMKFHLMTNTTGGMAYVGLFELYLDGNAIKMRAK
ncbi:MULTISPECIES: Ig-like domain-containing protein [Bacteroides]|uniref:Ig-like domain-containing protein n=1 Tax=Bacteroides TaxID=816 RepID=UPI001B3C8547|nr:MULTISPECIES: Ig-like domain-containing protein [Bacteroides]QUT24358.1 Bacterial Ig-like domain (group 2) [Bacteroides xylanisolvens]